MIKRRHDVNYSNFSVWFNKLNSNGTKKKNNVPSKQSGSLPGMVSEEQLQKSGRGRHNFPPGFLDLNLLRRNSSQ